MLSVAHNSEVYQTAQLYALDVRRGMIVAEGPAQKTHLDRPYSAKLTASQRAIAEDLLGTTSAQDFDDALRDALTSVDAWAWDAEAHAINLNRAARILGEPSTQRIYASINRVEARESAARGRREPQGARRWEPILYAEGLPPAVRINLCHMLSAQSAFFALRLANERGTILPSHIAVCLADTIERGADAILLLTES
jgi:hypothetical protein